MVDKTLIIQTAANIAQEISACAIIIMSADLSLNIDTNIPVLIASPTTMIMTGVFLEGDDLDDGKNPAQRLQNLSNTLYHKASSGSEFIIDASAAAFIKNLLEGDRVVGIVSYEGTTSIVIHDLKDNHIVKELKVCSERVDLEILKSVLLIAIELGIYGREGKSIGTAFIIGDAKEVMKRSHQLVLNPFLGHPEKDRNIRDTMRWETVKEFSQLDGVFILECEGYLIAAGRYLDVDAKDVETVKGLGGRHASAAAITRDTEAVAVTVSESDGEIRIYRDGIQVLEINPRSLKVSLLL
jgi:DNA integrity scanning protein DisA with diadenylate cyclase activity